MAWSVEQATAAQTLPGWSLVHSLLCLVKIKELVRVNRKKDFEAKKQLEDCDIRLACASVKTYWLMIDN